jgi:hypothetical protein
MAIARYSLRSNEPAPAVVVGDPNKGMEAITTKARTEDI